MLPARNAHRQKTALSGENHANSKANQTFLSLEIIEIITT